MAAAGMIRRLREVRGVTSDGHLEQEVDDRPEYLRLFPNPSSVVKDIQLGVLLGRFANIEHEVPNHSFDYFHSETL
jgi:hypothetical protein